MFVVLRAGYREENSSKEKEAIDGIRNMMEKCGKIAAHAIEPEIHTVNDMKNAIMQTKNTCPRLLTHICLYDLPPFDNQFHHVERSTAVKTIERSLNKENLDDTILIQVLRGSKNKFDINFV